jgi:hypothetical protein
VVRAPGGGAPDGTGELRDPDPATSPAASSRGDR